MKLFAHIGTLALLLAGPLLAAGIALAAPVPIDHSPGLTMTVNCLSDISPANPMLFVEAQAGCDQAIFDAADICLVPVPAVTLIDFATTAPPTESEAACTDLLGRSSPG